MTAEHSPAMHTRIVGDAVVDDALIRDAVVDIHGDTLGYVGSAEHAPNLDNLAPEGIHTIAHDGLILPGLIDVHNHGGAGVSFPDLSSADEALTAIAEHRAHGTTGMLASLVTASPDSLRRSLEILHPLVRSGDLLGVHLEGPFISPARAGAQNPAHITPAVPELIEALGAEFPGTIATMTLAPETEDAHRAAQALASIGALPSWGHTDASAEVMDAAISEAGRALSIPHSRSALPTVTHLFNGMRPIHHRDPGPAMSALHAARRGEAVVELIADGVHLDASMVKYCMDLAATGMVLLVTDAMAAAGMPDGSYTLGSLDVTVDAGIARLTDGGAIAGGTAHLLDVVRFCVQQCAIPVEIAVAAATSTPARLLGITDRGSLRSGARADLVLVSKTWGVAQVFLAGAPI